MLTDGFLEITKRPRRNRKSDALRSLIQETRLHPNDFVAPFFVVEGSCKKIPILSMPGVFRFSIDELLKELTGYVDIGIRAINLFCYTPEEKKDSLGSEARREGNLLQQAIKMIKNKYPELLVMADIALDPFTDHGHDGIVINHRVANDPTIEALSEMALRAAEAGCDVVSPSDMMDGRIGYIRKALDKAGFHDVGILSYAAKYASAFYGPFRDALDSAPKFGDKKNYQMNPANSREALLECALDEEEGADMLLIKPALTNLDILAKVRQQTMLPLGAYQVSGEYAMIKVAAEKGILDEKRAFFESLLAIKRAGADFIFTYAAKQVAEEL
ncbi:MAG: porphobilinogen synthase [Chlamydiia bacterium]|nr:porphobilinogen synthase [Chlamydiia bacterium]